MQLWDFSSHLNGLAELDSQGAQGASSVFNQAPLMKFKHKDEGYALDWSPLVLGRLVSGTVRQYFCLCFSPTGTLIASCLTYVKWSNPLMMFLSEGDCQNCIHLWEPTSGATWNVDTTPFVGHAASVEDLQVYT